MLGLAENLLEYQLAAARAVAGKGVLRVSVTVSAVFAQTQCLHF